MRKLITVVLGISFLLATIEVAAAPAPSRLQVTEREWRLNLSRSSIKSGPAIFELVNLGEDPHDLHFRRKGSRYTYKMAEIKSMTRSQKNFRLRKGTYHLWCSLPGHKALGMKATLKVK